MQTFLFGEDIPSVKELSPPLKWAGGKRWLVPQLREVWAHHAHCRLVEPFSGGLAIALGLMPKDALLNDINPHLINFYHWLQKGLKLELKPQHDEPYFYQKRQRFNDLVLTRQETSQEAAELFYYLNRTCFNGLCRFNKSGGFNVPFGKYTTINYATDFLEYQSLVQPWNFTIGDFEKITLEPDDFVYADPPYDVEFTTYSAGGFTWDDQIRVARWLAAHTGVVITSNQATPRIIDLYTQLGFQIKTLEAPRRISSSGDRTPALEMLAYRNTTWNEK